MKLKLRTLADNHRFHYLTGKHKMFDVTVATKNINTRQNYIHGIVAYRSTFRRPNVCEIFTSFCQVLKRCTQKKTGSFFSASRCSIARCVTRCGLFTIAWRVAIWLAGREGQVEACPMISERTWLAERIAGRPAHVSLGIRRMNWRHRIYGYDTIAILLV